MKSPVEYSKNSVANGKPNDATNGAAKSHNGAPRRKKRRSREMVDTFATAPQRPMRENFRRLLPYLKPQRKTIVLAVTCLVVAALLDGLFLLLFNNVLRSILNVSSDGATVQNLVQNVNAESSQSFFQPVRNFLHSSLQSFNNFFADEGGSFGGLNKFIALILLVGLGQGITDYGQTYLTQRIGQRALTRLRSDMFARFQSLSVGFFEKRRTGELMSRMTNDLGALQSLMSSAVTTSIKTPLATIITLGFMISLNWQLTLFVILILPPIAFLINRAGRKIRRATAQMQGQLGEMTNYLQEKISAMRLIQTFGTQPLEIARFKRVNEDSYQRAMQPVRIRATLAPTIDFIGLSGVLVTLWFGVRSGMKLNDLMTFLFAMHRTGMNLKAIAGLSTLFSGASAAADRLFEMLDMQPEVQDKPDAIDLKERELQGHLAFENVRFAYGNGPEVLHGVSFEIKPGEVVALAGLSGSGKTTISNLVPRLYDPSGGRVLVDGLDLRDVKMQSLRAHIGAVPQETTLFHGTIADNIAYGKPDATREEIIEAAKQANAHNFIEAQPEGYDTPIGERGGRLSGGQRQRIAIARALLRDPRILILDEATSSLDAESESLVQDALATLMKGRTTLIIAHRFSTIRHADKIIVLEQGDIAEVGTHDELLDKNGIYHRLYHMQTFQREILVKEIAAGDLDDELENDFDDQEIVKSHASL